MSTETTRKYLDIPEQELTAMIHACHEAEIPCAMHDGYFCAGTVYEPFSTCVELEEYISNSPK